MVRTTLAKSLAVMLYPVLYFLHPPLLVWTVESLNRFTGSMVGTTVDSYLYGASSKLHPVEFHLNREVHLALGRTFIGLTMSLILLKAPAEALWICIFLSGLLSLNWIKLRRIDHLLHHREGDLA